MRKSLKMMVAATLTSLTLAMGCAAETRPHDPSQPSQPSTPSNPSNPTNPDSPPTNPDTPPEPEMPVEPDPTYAGSYLIKTKLDLGGKNVLPGPGGAIVNFIADIDDKPFTALIYVLKDAGIPDVSAFLQGLPTFLLDVVGGVGDQIIVTQVFDQNPELKAVLTQIGNVGELFKNFEIHNQLSVGAKMNDTTYKVAQQVLAIGFDWNGVKKAYDLSPAARAAAQIKGKSLLITNEKTFADFDGTFDGGSVNLPIGDILIKAINDLVLSPFGYSSLGDVMAQVIPCDQLAAEAGVDALETVCQTLVVVVTEAALAPIKNFTLNGVVLGHAELNGFDRKAAETPDYQTDKVSGKQPIQLLSIDGTTVQFQAATFTGERLAAAIVPPVFQ